MLETILELILTPTSPIWLGIIATLIVFMVVATMIGGWKQWIE